MEIWKDIDFNHWFPGLSCLPIKNYQVSNFGNIRSESLASLNYLPIKPRAKSNGLGNPYLIFNVGSGNKSQIRVSKCVTCAFLDCNSQNYYIQHNDNNYLNCHLDNLTLIYQLKIKSNQINNFNQDHDVLSSIRKKLLLD